MPQQLVVLPVHCNVSLLLLPQVQQVRPSNPVFTRQQQLQHTYQNAARLLKEHSLPSPLWIVAAPLAQVGSYTFGNINPDILVHLMMFCCAIKM